MPNANRDAGHRFERDTANAMRKCGFVDCVTSRAESKSLDDAGIDLCNTGPLAVQCKRTKKQPRFCDLLKRMDGACKTHRLAGNVPVVYHKTAREPATVTMLASDFEEIAATLVAENIWKP